ncbi:GH3 auxin-responsive promoter family protein [Candidatus Gracilibacteria bacterium]|nr:GH3 auxin-responsive promoter family protein [Candidatus Gracilibacteria bacterium]
MPSRVINKVIKSYLILHSHIHQQSIKNQEKIIFGLIKRCKDTVWGRKYGYENIKTIKDYQNQVPISHYKDLEPRITYMLKGEKDITYPGKIDWFATSSGTTGGTAKYIPITKDNLRKSHFKGGMETLSLFVKNNPRSQFFKGKGLVIGGSFGKNPYTGESNVGFISAILQKEAPWIGQHFREPRPEISYMENREEKSQIMIEEAVKKNITFLNGQPSWGSNFLYKVLEYTGKKNILEVWPKLELFYRGGMSMDLYRSQFHDLMPSKKMKYYQVYNASEGYFAVQDQNKSDDMLLLTYHGVFYEFIPFEEYGKTNPTVLTLAEIEVDRNYVIMITNNSGLRRYVLGDTIVFTSIKPRRIKVSGRTKYYIDVVGECVTSNYTDKALMETCKLTNTIATDYTVAPLTYTGGSVRGCYEWIVEFTQMPTNIKEFESTLDQELCNVNSYYFDERHDTKVLGKNIVHAVPQGTFYNRMKSKNRLGGQFKVPKLSSDRKHVDEILDLIGD